MNSEKALYVLAEILVDHLGICPLDLVYDCSVLDLCNCTDGCEDYSVDCWVKVAKYRAENG